jgi:hypothetical protein
LSLCAIAWGRRARPVILDVRRLAADEMSDEEVLTEITSAFAGCPRPDHFTNYRHCCECYEHDELLRSRTRDDLGMADVGSEAWDPICFVSPEAFAYLMPALARLALGPQDAQWGWYGSHLAFHLAWDGPENARWLACTERQRCAVAALIAHMLETRTEFVDASYRADLFLQALEIWLDPMSRPNETRAAEFIFARCPHRTE